MTIQPESQQKPCQLIAYDKHRNIYLGAIADLTPDNLLLLSDAPVAPDYILELRLQCTAAHLQLDGVQLGVQVSWCVEQEHACWIGMQIISVDDQVQERLATLSWQAPMKLAAAAHLSA